MVLSIPKKNMMVYHYIQLYHNPYGIYDLWPMTMAFPMASEAVARWATASARWPCRRTNRGRRRWSPGATPSSPHCCGRRRGAVAGSQGPPGAPGGPQVIFTKWDGYEIYIYWYTIWYSYAHIIPYFCSYYDLWIFMTFMDDDINIYNRCES
jgi:hypothetical protein